MKCINAMKLNNPEEDRSAVGVALYALGGGVLGSI